MKIILLSGGSGKRLWPLSNDSRSKQFLNILQNSNDKLESMVQRVWKQIDAAGLTESSYIAANRAQEDIIKHQLGDNIRLVLEPSRKDTFAAISLASSYLHSIEKIDINEILCILPVDPFVENSFFYTIQQLEEILNQSNYDIALIGVKPTYPAETYGYIVPVSESLMETDLFYKVSHFKEKPNIEEAKKLIKNNALWNCGVFLFRLGYMISYLHDLGLPVEYEELVKIYDTLPNKSFDYQVLEKSDNVIVVPYSGTWKDLGTWNTLSDELLNPKIGKGLICDKSMNTQLINELNIPVIISGLKNVVVAAGPDGILVAEKSSSSKIKELVQNFNDRPMYEERRWGWYRVLDYTSFIKEGQVLTKRIRVFAGKNLSYQFHYNRSEVWTIISGEGEFVLDDTLYNVKKGDVLQIPVCAKHGIKAITDLEFIEVQSGSELVEDDIVRICLCWEHVKERCNTRNNSL